MLKIVLSLIAFALVVWLPIGLYLFWDKKNTPGQQIWARKAASVAPQRFGKGSLEQFDKYLERPSTVEVHSISGICEWLLACKYTPDQELFKNPDLWQHPIDFERSRQGDCEDHTLWAWRKCHDLGIDAVFVVGKIYLGNGVWGDHTWLILSDQKGERVLETTAKKPERCYVPLVEARNRYQPFYGIDNQLRSFIYDRQPNA